MGNAMSRPMLLSRTDESPLGTMIAVADAAGLRLLEFHDRRRIDEAMARLRSTLGPIVPGESGVLDRVRGQMAEYFAGNRREFDLPLSPVGTPFRMTVWQALQKIPFGVTISYGELARRIGDVKAVRAVAQAIGQNFLAIVIPCHRVIGADGTLTGYGGGIDRKRWLLEHEARVAGVQNSCWVSSPAGHEPVNAAHSHRAKSASTVADSESLFAG